jgi:hypothetical protein
MNFCSTRLRPQITYKFTSVCPAVRRIGGEQSALGAPFSTVYARSLLRSSLQVRWVRLAPNALTVLVRTRNIPRKMTANFSLFRGCCLQINIDSYQRTVLPLLIPLLSIINVLIRPCFIQKKETITHDIPIWYVNTL